MPARSELKASCRSGTPDGTRAYRTLHPRAQDNTAATNAWRMLKKTEIRTEFERRRKERWKRLEMTAAEAAALVALRAHADIGQAFDETGEMLPVHRWPEELRLAVKSVRGEHVTLHDGLKACEVVLQMLGKLNNAVDVRL